jgi:hypothetical protein
LYEFDDHNNNDDDNDGIKQMTVNKGEAIAFPKECFHAGGQNSSNKFLYRLFAYIVRNISDFPAGTVFTRNESNMKKLQKERAAPRGIVPRTKKSGRITRKPEYLSV